LAPSRSIAVPRDVRREWGEPDIDSQDGTWDSDPNDPMEFYAERGDVCSRDMSRRRRKHTDEVAFSDGDRSPFIKPSVRYLSLEFGDLELAAGGQAVAIPPGSIWIPAREKFGAHAARIARVGECVCARC
jgi:hypothetical protein